MSAFDRDFDYAVSLVLEKVVCLVDFRQREGVRDKRSCVDPARFYQL